MHRLGAESCSPPVRLGFRFRITHQPAEIHLLPCGRRAGIGCLATAAMCSGTAQQPATCSRCAFHRPRRSWRHVPPHWGTQQRRGMVTPHATGVKPRPHHEQVHFSTASVCDTSDIAKRILPPTYLDRPQSQHLQRFRRARRCPHCSSHRQLRLGPATGLIMARHTGTARQIAPAAPGATAGGACGYVGSGLGFRV